MDPHDRIEYGLQIKKLGIKLAEFAVNHANQIFTPEDVLDAQLLLPYLIPYAVEVLSPSTTGSLPLPDLQLYLDFKVVQNLTKLLEELVPVCIPEQLAPDDVCEASFTLYCAAFAALTRIAEQARAQETPQGRAVALKLLDQLQPENHGEAPGDPEGLGVRRARGSNLKTSQS
jgi:hypothetical protein